MSTLELYGDVRDTLIGLPHYAHDDVGTALRADGYEARFAAVKQELGPERWRMKSVFEFGCQYGLGLITLLEACPNADCVGWVDNESAHPGSNQAAAANLQAWHRKHRKRPAPRLKLKTWSRARDVQPDHFDVVMVDGGHAYHEALCDLALARAMRPRLLIVDDFPGMPSVRDAVEHFALYYELRYEIYPHAGAGLAVFNDLG